jgi:DNA gyrase/topoisomerase IV subunit A
MLTSFLTLSLTVFSQTDTTNQVKCFPIPTVKKIMKDLLSGDQAKAQLKLTEEQLTQTEKKVVLKDSVINTMKLKEVNYLTIIDSEKQKFGIMENYSKKLEWDLKKERVKGKFKSILGTGVIVILTGLLIVR